MNNSATPQSVRWIVHETGNRWSNSIRRFYHHLIPPEIEVTIHRLGADQDLAASELEPRQIVLWEVNRHNLVDTFDRLLLLRNTAVSRLQLIACDRLTLSQRLALAEFDISGFLEQPEGLYQIKPVFDGYFARLGWSVD
ncbi:MAG: hypothetical protein ACPHL6_05140 [Rubripirellula sp.]